MIFKAQPRPREREERFIRGKLRISKRQDKFVLPGIRVSHPPLSHTVQTWKVDKKVGVVFEIALTFEMRVFRGGGRVLFKAFKRQEATRGFVREDKNVEIRGMGNGCAFFISAPLRHW